MEKLLRRKYSHDSDLDPICSLVGRNGIRPNIMDIAEILEVKQNQEKCQVWADAYGNLKALALVDGYQNLWFDSGEDVDVSALLNEILPWAVDIARRLFGEESLDACEYADSKRLPYLMDAGFVETGLRTFRYIYKTSGTPIQVYLPPGFRIRTLHGEGELPAWLELHRKAHHESRLDEDYRNAMMITPAYDPTMDFVMESPQGTLAAYCVCTFERSLDGELVGYTDPIAVDPDYQGMGLGKAILSHSINQLVERGADAVELGTSSENLPMQRLAESVGYQRIEEKIWLRLEK